MLRVPFSLSALVGLALIGCGGSSDAGNAADSTTSDSASDVSSDVARDATSSETEADAFGDTDAVVDTGATPETPPSETGSDVAADTASDPLASLLGCLGTSAPLTVSAQMPYTNVPVGSESGEFLVDFASTFSSIDLHAFAAPGPATSGCDPTKLGVTCTVDGFAFFSAPGPVLLVTEDFSHVSGGVRQAGIVGTDFTSLKIVTLDYARGRIFVSPASGFCDDTAMRSAGLGSLPTSGFFTNDLSKLAPLSDVDSSASSGQVPNVPTVNVTLAGHDGIAQLDTGFDDGLVHFSVNVNPAFRDEILSADPSALVRDASHDLVLSTCLSGVTESAQAYTLGAGRTLDFVDGTTLATVRRVSGVTVFVKTSSPKACGGIGTWTTPAAQIAASFFVDMGVIAFDPYSSRVWMTD